jgi:hypothetical protein
LKSIRTYGAYSLRAPFPRLRQGDDDLRGRDPLELEGHGLLEVLQAVPGDEGRRAT